MSRRSDAIDALIGVAVIGVKVGEASARVGLATAEVAMRTPVLGAPLRAATSRVIADGQRARREAIGQLEATVDRVVDNPDGRHDRSRRSGSPAMQHAIDHLADKPRAAEGHHGADRRHGRADAGGRPAPGARHSVDVTERTVRR